MMTFGAPRMLQQARTSTMLSRPQQFSRETGLVLAQPATVRSRPTERRPSVCTTMGQVPALAKRAKAKKVNSHHRPKPTRNELAQLPTPGQWLSLTLQPFSHDINSGFLNLPLSDQTIVVTSSPTRLAVGGPSLPAGPPVADMDSPSASCLMSELHALTEMASQEANHWQAGLGSAHMQQRLQALAQSAWMEEQLWKTQCRAAQQQYHLLVADVVVEQLATHSQQLRIAKQALASTQELLNNAKTIAYTNHVGALDLRAALCGRSVEHGAEHVTDLLDSHIGQLKGFESTLIALVQATSAVVHGPANPTVA